MRFIYILMVSTILISSGVLAQVKDSVGNTLSAGQPATPVKDFDGGTISRGRVAKCVVGPEVAATCIFYPRNGDGGFAIDVGGSAYYATKSSPTEIDVDYDNGARMVPQGSYTRSTRNPACWLQGAKGKLCIY